MVILQSGDCYYNGTDAESVTFTSTLVVHVILLLILFFWCVFWFFYCCLNIKNKNHKKSGVYSTIAKDAPEKGINYKRWKDYFMMAWNFFQLFSFSFSDDFAIKSSDDSIFSISWLDTFLYYAKFVILQIGYLGNLILFFIMLIIIIVCISIVFVCSCTYKRWECIGCTIECDSCKQNCKDLRDISCKGYRKFFQSVVSLLTCGFCRFTSGRFYFCYLFSFECDESDSYYECCGCRISTGFFEYIPFILKTIVYDVLYIPILSSLIKVFVCTYTCDYNSSIMNKEEAYPPLDAYTSISCNSSYTIICFILSFFAIAFYHVRASYYICVELDKNYSGDVSTNQRFQYIQMIGRFILTVLSSMFYFIPFVPLTLNLLVFLIILIVVLFIPSRTAFTMEHSRLYIALYSIQVLTSLMALLSQIFSSDAALFSVLAICFIPTGFILGYTFVDAHSLKDTYPYVSLRKMMLNQNDSVRLLSAKALIDEFKTAENNELESIIKKKMEMEKNSQDNYQSINKNNLYNKDLDSNNDTTYCINLQIYFYKFVDIISFRSIYHRELSVNELIKKSGDVLMESVRKSYNSVCYEMFEDNKSRNDEKEVVVETEKKDINENKAETKDNTINNKEDSIEDIERKEMDKDKAKTEGNIENKKEESPEDNEKNVSSNYETLVQALISLIENKNNILSNKDDNRPSKNLVSLNIFPSSSFILVRDGYVIEKLNKSKNYKNERISDLLIKLLKSTSNYLREKNKESTENIYYYLYRDYMFSSFYYPNSIIISLPPFLDMNILSLYSYLFYNKLNLLYLYSYVIISLSLIVNSSNVWGFDYNFSFCYLFIVNIEKSMKILLPYLKINPPTQIDFSAYRDRFALQNIKILFSEDLIKIKGSKNHTNEILSEKYCLFILSFLSSIFKKDWRFCAFFATYINEKIFVDTFRNDKEYNKLKEQVKNKEIFDEEQNDSWLMNRLNFEDGRKNEKVNELYLKFEYDKQRCEQLISDLEKKGKNFHNFITNKIDTDYNISYSSLCDKEVNFDDYTIISKNIVNGESIIEQENNNIQNYFNLEKTESKSSQGWEELNKNKKNNVFITPNNNQTIPIIIKYLILCLYSKNDNVKEYALLALSSFFDKEKSNNEKENKEIGPSVIHMILDKMKEWGLLYEIKNNVNNCIKKKNELDFNIEIKTFHLFYVFVTDCFELSVVLDNEKRKEYILSYCNSSVIRWVGSFYDYEEKKEKVLRLLYILISYSEDFNISDLFSFEDSSAFLILSENGISVINNSMSFFSVILIMESWLKTRKNEIIDENLTEEIRLWLLIILIFLKNIKIDYVYSVIEILLEKYDLFEGDLSVDKSDKLKKELLTYIYKDWIEYIRSDNLSTLSLTISNHKTININGNMIYFYAYYNPEYCIFNKEMNKVYFYYSITIIIICLLIRESIICLFFYLYSNI